MFKNSKYLDANGAIDFGEFTTLLTHEPRLMKAMFSTIMAQFARQRGIKLDEPVMSPRSGMGPRTHSVKVKMQAVTTTLGSMMHQEARSPKSAKS